MTTLTKKDEADKGAARGSFCAKHNEYSHTSECRWCEPAKEDHRAAAPRPLDITCTALKTLAGQAWAEKLCGQPAAWIWRSPERVLTGEPARHFFCEECHQTRVGAFRDWAHTPIQGTAPRPTPVDGEPCTSVDRGDGTPLIGWCGAPSAWKWLRPDGDAAYFCDQCHAYRERKYHHLFAHWTKTPVGNAAPQETPP